MLIQSHCYKNEKKNGKNSCTIPLGNTKVTSYSVSVFFPLFFDFVFICPQCWFLSLQLWCSEWKICLEIPCWNYGTSFGEWRSSFFFISQMEFYMLVTFSYISWCFVLRFVSVRTSSKLKASAEQNSCNSSKETKCAQNVIQCVILDAKKLYQSGLKRR